MLAFLSLGTAPSGGRGSAAGGGAVVGIQQEITPREQKVTTLEQDLEAAQSQTTERKQVPAGT